ncbi:hypothetical protein Ancab_014235 [Ancistrocladus abbreviatus]
MHVTFFCTHRIIRLLTVVLLTGRLAFLVSLPYSLYGQRSAKGGREMGNSSSSSTNPRFSSATSSLAVQSQNSHGEFVSPSVFKAYFGIPDPLGGRMFDLATEKRRDQKLTFEDLVIAKAVYEKGTKDEIEEFIHQLLDINGDGTLGRSNLEAVLAAILDDLFSRKDRDSGSSSNKYMIDVLLNAATFLKCDVGNDEESMSFEDFKSWCSLLPSVRKYLVGLLMPPNSGRPGSKVPHLLYPDDSASNLILMKEYAWLIGGAISQQELEEWRLLYHSSRNGLSFNTFLGSVSNFEGPTVLIIKDKEGYIYGGYASQSWEKHGGFYGDLKSFLFQLFPKASIFRATGANNNLQWCAVNFSSETIPNGIGYGGRVNHFGLFLSASFDHGHTFPCTTFGSPCLSKSNQIHPEVIECWGTMPKVSQQESADAVRGTVLERFKEDRHMLNMVGVANSSE